MKFAQKLLSDDKLWTWFFQAKYVKGNNLICSLPNVKGDQIVNFFLKEGESSQTQVYRHLVDLPKEVRGMIRLDKLGMPLWHFQLACFMILVCFIVLLYSLLFGCGLFSTSSWIFFRCFLFYLVCFELVVLLVTTIFILHK